MKTIAKHFLQGLLVFVPIAGSISVVAWVLKKLDGLYPLPVPGLGLAITLVAITLLGFLTSNVVGRKLFEWVEAGMKRLPVVNLLYSSLRDLLGAFVGDKRSFDKPVMVRLLGEGGARVFGFVTCDRFDDVRLEGHVAVYLPQSYNFAGNLIIVRREQVEPVDADSAQFMAFIVSGGVAEMRAARTVFDEEQAVALRKRKR
ncbi:MAG: DUF502 domain-containing protein [Sandaracinaceae bacterium]|nr:DUF502 domain-containing protein [Sandaracinaceae bacterium]